MNELQIARNRAKHFGNKFIVEYRYRNNSIYQGNVHYSETNSLEEFKDKMSSLGHIIQSLKIYEEV